MFKSGYHIQFVITIVDYQHWHLIRHPNWISVTKKSHLCQLYPSPSNICQWVNTGVPIQGHIKRVFRNTIEMSLFEARILRILGPAGGYGLSGHAQQTRKFSMYITCEEVQWMCCIPPGKGHYLVIRQFQLGEGRLLFGCQTVPIGCDKYVICWVSLVVQRNSHHGEHTMWTGDW